MSVDTALLESHLESLTQDYYDLQASVATVLSQPPSALEALRMTSKAHPTVIRGYIPLTEGEKRDWRDPAAYIAVLGDAPLTIAVTDDGLADSVRELDDGTTTFVKPLEERMTASQFLKRLVADDESTTAEAQNDDGPLSATSPSKRTPTPREALYLQSQDGNIYRSEPGARGAPELAAFQPIVSRDVPWMREALGASADAVNLWIGNSASTTSFHHDPYENIYCVLSGSKTFTLLSPLDGLWFEQRFHPPSTLTRDAETGALAATLDEAPAPTYPVPWVAELDPPPQARPVCVTLNAGETLYLPAGWWHKVEQAGDDETGLAVAVNYWYSSEINPQRYALERFAQRVARTAGREVLPVDVEVDDSVWGSEVDSADEWDPKDWGR